MLRRAATSTLRHRLLALWGRFALAWFALSLAVAVAAPMVQPQSMEIVCTSAGMAKLVVKSEDGAPASDRMPLDCPLCLTPLGAPPPAPTVWSPRLDTRAQILPPAVTAPLAVATAAPLWARGPPAL